MSQTIKGVVEKVSEQYSKAGSPKKWVKKSFLVDGKWFGAFINKDNDAVLGSVREGSTIEVEYEMKGEFFNVVKVSTLSAPAAAASPQVQESVAKLNDKDIRITYNGSLKSAIAFVEAGVRLDMIALPVKKDAKLDAFYEYVKHYTNVFVADTYAAKLTPDTDGENDAGIPDYAATGTE